MPSDGHFSTAKIKTFWKFIFQKKPKLILFPFANIFQITPWVLGLKYFTKMPLVWRVMFLLSNLKFGAINFEFFQALK